MKEIQEMIPEILDVTGKLILTNKISDWCQLPYPNHPKGCPNYGNKPDCPPNAPDIDNYFNLKSPHYFVIIKFNLGYWSKEMKKLHPNWSEKQCRCVLYWQNRVRKFLKRPCEEFKDSLTNFDYTLIPEAMGVNVIRTALKIGIPIKPKPKEIVYKIAFMGYIKEI